MYHHVDPNPGDDVWTVSRDEFRRQIAELKAAGFETVRPGDLPRVGRLFSGLPAKPLVITFDDGLLSALTEAEPVLKDAGFHATVYLITGFVGESPSSRLRYRNYDCLSWEEIRAMHSRGTISFGIHSHSHSGNAARQALEAGECRNILRRNGGFDSSDYCYPYGSAPDVLVRAVSNVGFRTAMVCEDRIFFPSAESDLLRIPRVSVYGGIHHFTVQADSAVSNGCFSATAVNRGVPLPVRPVLRHSPSGRSWLLQPSERLGPEPRRWIWTHLPERLSANDLSVEIWEQNGLFRYHP